MSYLVLARKYRPQNFDEVIRQEHVTRTLKNAISTGRVAHAILFQGPRGTGKTTVARILAKAMNCETGPTPTPCNQCRSCREITAGSAVDVLEIDGASNNGVEQVRELRENVRYMPARSRYKIYIIDEVHMLSIAAFNALLKTLEEPPAHVMFLLATTEANKIPVTILSRCQRHDFRRIDASAVTEHMAALCRMENRAVDAETLSLISREAGGGMRDALSLLDQVLAASEGEVRLEQVLDLVGAVDRKTVFDLSGAILSRDLAGFLHILADVYDRGRDIKKLYADLLSHFRDLLVVKMGQDVERLVDTQSHEIERMAEQVADIAPSTLQRIFEGFFREEAAIRLSAHPRFALEMAVISLVESMPAVPIELLIEKMDALGKSMESGGYAAPPAGGPQPGGAEKRPEAGPAPEKPAPPQRPEPVQKPAAAPEKAPSARMEAPAEKPPRPEPPPEPESPPPLAYFSSDDTPEDLEEPDTGYGDGDFSSSDTTTAEQKPEPAPVAEKAAPQAPVAKDLPDPGVDDPETLWKQVLEVLEGIEGAGSLASCLKDSRVKSSAGNALEVAVGGPAFNLTTARKKKNQAVIGNAIQEISGRALKIRFVSDEGGGQGKQKPRRKTAADSKLKNEYGNHPLVREAMEIFEIRGLPEVRLERE